MGKWSECFGRCRCAFQCLCSLPASFPANHFLSVRWTHVQLCFASFGRTHSRFRSAGSRHARLRTFETITCFSKSNVANNFHNHPIRSCISLRAFCRLLITTRYERISAHDVFGPRPLIDSTVRLLQSTTGYPKYDHSKQRCIIIRSSDAGSWSVLTVCTFRNLPPKCKSVYRANHEKPHIKS